MFYIYLIKKSQHDNSSEKLLKFLNYYYSNYGKSNFFISFPGFIGNSKKSIDDFGNKFLNNNGIRCEGIFANAMNSNVVLSNGLTNLKYLNKKYNKHGYKFSSSLKDHSKLIVFLDNNIVLNNSDFNIENYIKNANVNCLVIGSSNQSKNTYLNCNADKGEADIVLINESVFENEKKKISKNESNYEFTTDYYAISFANKTEIEGIYVSKQIGKKSCNDLRTIFNSFLEQ